MKGIYSITNTINGKRYIGMSNNIKIRWRNHKTELKKNKHHSSKLQNAWNKYGKDAFKFEVLHEVDCMEGLELTEKELIKKYDSFKNGYNCSEGGEKLPGYVQPENTRQALLKRNAGNKYFEGKKHDEETKQLMSKKHSGENNPFYGKKHTEESLNKTSEASIQMWKDNYEKHYNRLKTLNQSPERREAVSKQMRGENNRNAKFTEYDAIQIRIRYLKGEIPSKIHKDYQNTSLSGLKKICYGSSWKHIPKDLKELENMLINYQCQ